MASPPRGQSVTEWPVTLRVPPPRPTPRPALCRLTGEANDSNDHCGRRCPIYVDHHRRIAVDAGPAPEPHDREDPRTAQGTVRARKIVLTSPKADVRARLRARRRRPE